MRICIIANGYPNSRDPQWGCFEHDQAVALRKEGHEVAVLYVDGRFRSYWRKVGLTHFDDNGISVYGYFLMPMQWLRKFSNKLNSRIYKRLSEKVYKKYSAEKGKPDIIYAHYAYNIARAVHLKEKFGVPVVGIEHWSELTKDELIPMVRYYANAGYYGADRLLAVSQSLQAHIKRHFEIDATVVYDMLGPEFISNAVKDRGITHPFRFIAVGNLIPRKGFDLLLQAFNRSGLKEKGCSVVIIGDGPERANLLYFAKDLDISECVCLTGRKTKDEIIREMHESHAFVLSSLAETFGVVCIEALSQGLPTIATVCGGPEEFINEQNGILIPTDDVEALSDAMIDMYNNYSKYDSMAIAEDCKRRFAPEVIASQLTEIFEEVINK